ncbi:hypothetical protein [Streptomyces caelestis]|uniref:hypothetical protein n=1 Tax=Streptomyces caelestis TaxID=36816 RepID=UPI003657B6D6
MRAGTEDISGALGVLLLPLSALVLMFQICGGGTSAHETDAGRVIGIVRDEGDESDGVPATPGASGPCDAAGPVVVTGDEVPVLDVQGPVTARQNCPCGLARHPRNG